MLNRVRRYIAEHRLLAVGDRVVVAVSGGADSVALLDLLANLAELDLSLVVAHLNHNLRAGEAEADAAFVRELAGRYGVLAEIGTTDVRKLAEQRRLSL
ncbi:MAG TPA: ATP-binding protein, partial [Geobacteraceae bacterium]|nr:ATP-binding protein [Geobacteraceae bacterium]